MSKTNDNKPSPAAVEQALAEEKANAEKIGATVELARANATQPGSVEAQDHLGLRVGHYASLLYACEQGSQSAAREVEKLILERDALQAQRDELLAACHAVMNWFTPPNDSKPFPGAQIAAAIARATSKQGLGGSDAESISTEGGQS